ncbi:universal stress protein [Hymenobacter arizonensis]|uniref:Nucleotide-binding universal stress protein, UspA family n=1 Tax=Hymenobacter arizonensis TaxID=1227077 RepID=A0A1I5U2Y4_HYMAR|nr:universal stress protein [Hymenobacter arizonensis]SFP89629.1 Nucleotide-binding universal stress protein, UspA family [Hymenobacter arizonensis]
MRPSLVVLTDFFAVTNRALSYAAGLAVPLNAQLVLLHARYDGLPVPEGFGDRHSPQGEWKTDQALLRLAAGQTVPTEVEVAPAFLPEAVNEAVRRHHPLFLVLARPHADPDDTEQLASVVMDLLRHAPHPLLLVPAAGWDAFPPRRLLLAVDGAPFTFNDQDHQEVLSRLLFATKATLDVVHVTDDEQARPDKDAVLETVRDNDLVSLFAESQLHEVYSPTVAGGVLEEAARQEADMLVVVVRRHTLFGSLFHRSVTAQLIQESAIPVLLLPAED